MAILWQNGMNIIIKGDDPCANSADCGICSTFSEDQKKKIRNRNRYKSKKDQNSSVSMDNGGKEGSIDDLLLDEDEVSFFLSSQVPVSQKNRSLEDKLDRFFSEFAVLSQRIQNLEQKDSETTCSHVSSSRDSVQVAKQPVVRSKSQPAASGSASLPKRSATITRAEFDQQSASGQFSEESGGRKSSYSQSSEEPDPDLEQSDTRSKDEDSPGYTETLETIKKWLDLEVKNVECFVAPSVFSSRAQVKKSVQQSMASTFGRIVEIQRIFCFRQ